MSASVTHTSDTVGTIGDQQHDLRRLEVPSHAEHQRRQLEEAATSACVTNCVTEHLDFAGRHGTIRDTDQPRTTLTAGPLVSFASKESAEQRPFQTGSTVADLAPSSGCRSDWPSAALVGESWRHGISHHCDFV